MERWPILRRKTPCASYTLGAKSCVYWFVIKRARIDNGFVMAYCTSCGKPIGDVDAYCRVCGKAQPTAAPTAPAPATAVPATPSAASQSWSDWRAGVAVRPLPSIAGRAGWAQAGLASAILASVLSIVATYRDIQLIETLQAGRTPSAATVDSVEALFAASGLAVAAAFLFAAITFCMWIHRASRCVEESRVGPMRFTAGWAVGWWFVPFMNLFRPYQVVAELWRASAADAHVRDWKRDGVSALLGWWWGIYIASGFVAGIAGGLDPEVAPTLEEAANYEWFWIAGDVVAIVAAVLAIAVVRGLSARIDARGRVTEQREFAAL